MYCVVVMCVLLWWFGVVIGLCCCCGVIVLLFGVLWLVCVGVLLCCVDCDVCVLRVV